jgi:tetratricopeptide (TPR) repeat protein
VVSHLRGDPIHANRLFKESLELFTRLHDVLGEASTYQWLGISALTSGRVLEAVNNFEQSQERWRLLGNQQMIAADLANLGEARHLAGSLDEAESLYRDALHHYEAHSDPMGKGFVLSQLGRLALDQNQLEVGLNLLLQGLELRWNAGDRGGTADTLDAMASAAVQAGKLKWAAQITETVDRLRRETGIGRAEVYERRFDEVKAVVGKLPPQTDTAATIDDLVDQLLSQTPALNSLPS